MQIRLAETEEDRAACLALRWEVFVAEQGVAPELERDGEDDLCTHVLAVDGAPVGAARFRVKGTEGKLQRICVPAAARARGIGGALVGFMVERLLEAPGVTRAILGAQTHAIGFYERLGFTAEGPEFDDAGIPHRMMVLALG